MPTTQLASANDVREVRGHQAHHLPDVFHAPLRRSVAQEERRGKGSKSKARVTARVHFWRFHRWSPWAVCPLLQISWQGMSSGSRHSKTIMPGGTNKLGVFTMRGLVETYSVVYDSLRGEKGDSHKTRVLFNLPMSSNITQILDTTGNQP